jgi:hypothetical protein
MRFFSALLLLCLLHPLLSLTFRLLYFTYRLCYHHITAPSRVIHILKTTSATPLVCEGII